MIRKRLLQFMYLVFKCLIGTGLKLFYPNTVLHNQHHLNTKGPLILICNHPNGMMDPINVAHHSNRMVHFLAKSQLFGNWFSRWFFNTFYCIPVQRSNFSTDQPVDNSRSFERCNEFLKEEGTLFVAPEGTSLNVRRILPLRTGGARIALSAEAENNFYLGVKFVATGVTYINQGSFWSGQYILSSPPFGIEEFAELNTKDNYAAVRKLTEKIYQELKKLNINLENDSFIPVFENLIRWFYPGIESNPEQFFTKGSRLAEQINHFEKHSPEKLNELLVRAGKIENFMKKWRLPATQLAFAIDRPSIVTCLLRLIVAIIGLPILIAGLLIHFIPNFIPWLIEKLARQHPIYIATTKFVSGFFLYLIYYPLLMKYTFSLGLPIIQTVFIIISAIVCGLLFFPYIDALQKLKTSFVSFFIKKIEKEMIKKEILTLKDLISS